MEIKITGMDINKRKEAFLWLQNQFPAAFPKTPIPLKIGIYEDITTLNQVDAPEHEWIKKALRYYTNSPRYLKQMIAGMPRIDLNGDVSGEVREQDAERANRLLKERQNKSVLKKTNENKTAAAS